MDPDQRQSTLDDFEESSSLALSITPRQGLGISFIVAALIAGVPIEQLLMALGMYWIGESRE